MNMIVLGSVIILYSLVQSLFGIGLLLFGTPTLLLLGFTFEQALSVLLPCSIAVNFLQIKNSFSQVTIKKDFLIYCLPLVVVGFLIGMIIEKKINIKSLVGTILLLTAFLRSSEKYKNSLEKIFKKWDQISLMVIGFVHGLTNMGGGFLTVFVSSLYKDKQVLRSTVAFGYLLMALSQCLILTLLRPNLFQFQNLAFIFVAMGTYLIVGNRIFKFASNEVYQTAFTIFIVAFGLLLMF